jgi:hypothetical protein
MPRNSIICLNFQVFPANYVRKQRSILFPAAGKPDSAS